MTTCITVWVQFKIRSHRYRW